jgi:hypothetical protein
LGRPFFFERLDTELLHLFNAEVWSQERAVFVTQRTVAFIFTAIGIPQLWQVLDMTCSIICASGSDEIITMP